MDKKLPHRIRTIKGELQSTGRLCSSDILREELCKRFPEYNRLKQQAFKRIISQELSSVAAAAAPPAAPAAAAAPVVAAAAPAPIAASEGGENDKGKKRKKNPSAEDVLPEGGDLLASPPATAAAPAQDFKASSLLPSAGDDAQAAAAVEGDGRALNDSLRKMYSPAPKAAAEPPPKKAVARISAAEKAARAAARREMGITADPEGSSNFACEERPEERLEDLGGIDSILQDLRQLIVQPLLHPEVFSHLGVSPPTGVLLHGPPGSGKTKLAHAIAGTTNVSFFKVAATEIVSGMSGESEAKIRQLFQAAVAAAPALLFLDEVDAITPKRDSAGREMERRIVAQMLTCMDDLRGTNVIVMGATNRPDALDPALRRAGRFDREIAMGIPDEAARAKILETMVRGMRLSGELNLSMLAQATPGFVGADLSALTKEAALSAVVRAFADLNKLRLPAIAPTGEVEQPREEDMRPYTAEEMACLAVDMKDFEEALAKVQPSSRREGFTTIPNIKWEDIGALQEVRSDLDAAVCEPIRKAALFKRFGLTVPVGVLLFGPPGCGKTLLAKAVANASGANFIAIKGPELLNKYVGESERAVRLVFQRAMSSSPCVIFFDELDALVPKRSSEGSSSSERVVNQMLTEMDGVQERSQVYVIAATNRPDIVDPAMLRPGRLDRLIYVPLPSEVGRLEILEAHMKKLPLAPDVDLKALAKSCDGFSGADLASLTREAAMLAIRTADMPITGSGPEAMEAAKVAAEKVSIDSAVLQRARQRTSPSVGKVERKEYEDLALRLCGWKREEAKDLVVE
mmetsp:Transcript_30568/g.65881  ORF Transcript_30568/g.65881 Transcript_30568/m.65881 type:complete len:802 (+) Transcript_30568:227-2632(+)